MGVSEFGAGAISSGSAARLGLPKPSARVSRYLSFSNLQSLRARSKVSQLQLRGAFAQR